MAGLLVATATGVAVAQDPTPQPVPQPVTPPPTTPPVTTPAQPTQAQQEAAALGKPVSNEQISEAIRKSGLNQTQIRDRLKAAGFDPGLADPFFVQPGATPAGPTPEQGSAFTKALTALGILSTQEPEEPEEPEDRLSRPTDSNRDGGIFGKRVFSGIGTQFDPVTAGPVDASYRIGAGDQLQLVVTGQVELAYQLDIRRDGTVIIPDVGQFTVAGLTLDAARTVIRQRMAGAYSGLSTGEAQLDLTISRVRVNSVFVIGEVESPGSYQVSALSTVFYALARAGGPSVRGSFRQVEVRRGGRLLRVIDLYDYLLRGDASNDIRTEQGDIIFVPLNTRAVAISGAVRRPAIFEMAPNETFGDLLSFAGGLLSSASLDRVQIDRVLPAEERRPGFDRVKLDVELNGRIDSLRAVKLYDSDIVTVFSIGDLRRNVVSVSGAVFQVGEFEYTPNMTLDTLLRRTQGPTPWALTDRIKVVRPIAATGRSETFSLNLADSAARNFRLAEFDQVVVLDGRVAFPAGRISIFGAVRKPFEGQYVENVKLRDVIDLADGFQEFALIDRIKVQRKIFATGQEELFSIDFRTEEGKNFPIAREDRISVLDARNAFPNSTIVVSGAVVNSGDRPFVQNETLRDAIDRANGFMEDAASVTVARRKVSASYNDTTSVLYEFPLDAQRQLPASAATFKLEPWDRVIVRHSPGYRAQRFATVQGLFMHPGAYAITENRDRLRDIVKRSGGLLPTAYDNSFKLVRGGRIVAVDFEKAMSGSRNHNVLLQHGDILSIDTDPRTVAVAGAVAMPSLLVYRPELTMSDYIEMAGGPTEKGDFDKATVEYPSGYSRRLRSFLGMTYSEPDIVSGSVIKVPEKPAENRTSGWEIMSRVVATLGTLAIAAAAVTR